MTAVFGVHLRETEYLAVGQRTAQTCRQTGEILLFLVAQGKSFGAVVFVDVFDEYMGCRGVVDVEYIGSGSGIYGLKHRVELRLLALGHRREHLNTRNAAETHILSNLNGIGAPRRNHFFAGTDESAAEGGTFGQGTSVSEKPAKAFNLACVKTVVCIHGIHRACGGCKKNDHR